MGEEMSRGLAAVQGEVKALRNEHGQAWQRIESRLAKAEGSGGDAEEDAESGGGGTPNRESSGGAHPKRRPKLRREFPELATLEPAEDDIQWPETACPERARVSLAPLVEVVSKEAVAGEIAAWRGNIIGIRR